MCTRIVTLEQCLDRPQQWTITTGEAIRTSKVRQMTESVSELSGAVVEAKKSTVLANRAAYKASRELIEQVFDPSGDFFTETVKPLVVQTANLTVGTSSQQFVIDNLLFGFDNNAAGTADAPYFFATANDSTTSPRLHHYAIDPDNVRTWVLNKSYTVAYGQTVEDTGEAFAFSSSTAGCYIYAFCPKYDEGSEPTELNGRIVLTDKQLKVETEDDTATFHFLLGMLSSEITTDGFISRSVTLTYGETTINGRFLRTGSKNRQQVSNVIWEIGSALADYTEAPEDVDYLREALTEATAGTTVVSGGLTLGSMICVGDTNNALRAGMMGTNAATKDAKPMIWAGSASASNEGIDSASFRVYNSGQVYMAKAKITTSGTEGYVTIDAGEITVAKTNGAMTTITSKAMGSLSSAIGKAGGDGQTDTLRASSPYVKATATAQRFSYGGYVAATVTKIESNTVTLTLYSSAPFSGYVSIATAYTVTGYPSISLNRSKSDLNKIIDGTQGTLSGSKAKFTTTATTSGSVTISAVYKNGTAISKSNGQYPITKGAKYTVKITVSASVTFSVIPTVNYGAISAWECYCDYDTASTTASATLTCTATSTECVNKYYADGFMIFNNTGTTIATQRYAGMTSADATVMQMRSANALLKFGANGLLQSFNGGTNYYRANPLVLIVRLTYNSGSIKRDILYNPLGKTVGATRNGTGDYTVTHGLGHTKYTLVGSGYQNDNKKTLYMSVISRTTTTVNIRTSDDSSLNDLTELEISFFDYKSY